MYYNSKYSRIAQTLKRAFYALPQTISGKYQWEYQWIFIDLICQINSIWYLNQKDNNLLER